MVHNSASNTSLAYHISVLMLNLNLASVAVNLCSVFSESKELLEEHIDTKRVIAGPLKLKSTSFDCVGANGMKRSGNSDKQHLTKVM